MNFAPLIVYGLIVTFIGGAIVAIDRTGYNRATRENKVVALKSELAAKETDLQASQAAAGKADAARAESQQAFAAAQTRIADYEEVIRKRGTATCPPITDDDVQRVRGNAGSNAGSKKSPAGK